MNPKIRDFLEHSDRYKYYCLLDRPSRFWDLFKHRNIGHVDVESIVPLQHQRGVVGWIGAFEWRDDKVVSLDGDAYYAGMTIYGYRYWHIEDKPNETRLCILVDFD